MGPASTEFLAPIEITGPGGDLHDRWAGGASAYLGMTVPGFPNLFLLYGPNTSSAHNSVIHMVESQVRYVLGCLNTIGTHGTMEVTESAHAEYQQHLETHFGETVWQDACHSWYKTESGRVAALYPLRAARYLRATRRPDLTHYRLVNR